MCFAGAWLTGHFHANESVALSKLSPSLANTCIFLDRIRLREFEGLRVFAVGAGIEEPSRVQQVLIWLHQKVPAFRFLAVSFASFDDWDRFDKFLEGMDLLGAELARHNL